MGQTNRTSSDRSTDDTSHRVSAELVDQQSSLKPADVSNSTRIVTVEEFADLTESDVISAAVKIVTPTVSRNQTATVRVVLTNISPHPLTVRSTGPLPLSNLESVGDAPRLQLLPVDAHDVQRTLNCWQPSERIAVDDDTTEIRLKQGEDLRCEYEVWSHFENTTCMAPGTYQFKTTYRVDAEERTSFDWSFTLDVDEP